MANSIDKRIEFLDWEFGIFFHFGIRTFYEGHVDWDNKPMSPEGFNPKNLDCEQWIKTAKDAGAKYTILTCKHHDGFALWPSAYTDYSVKNTPWKNGDGDVVREYTDACRKFDMKIGLYYSPAQFGSEEADSKSYDDYFINQISELLTNYGKIDYLWFDGCGSENHTYDTKRIVSEIRRLQPEILIFNMWDPDTRWVGNEEGYTYMPNNLVTSALDFSVNRDIKDCLEGERFLPCECDCRIRNNWFYGECDSENLKSVDALMGIYYYSVGRGANLLLNIGPDREGLIQKSDADRLFEFAREIKKTFSSPVEVGPIEKEGDVFSVESAEGKVAVKTIEIQEDITDGNKIEAFEVSAHMPTGQKVTVYSSSSVGRKHLCLVPVVMTTKISVKVLSSKGDYKINSIKLYK